MESTHPLLSVEELAARFQILRDAKADALVWLGYGGMVVDDTVGRALASLDWDPPRIMTTAFMQYIWGFDQLEGWVGIDQWCPDNQTMQEFHAGSSRGTTGTLDGGRTPSLVLPTTWRER